jgi:hypothetical protein
MARRDEIDVVAAQLLQAKHLVGQLFCGDRLTVTLPTDVEVLAEHTAKVALAEEDRTGTCPASQTILLAVMGKCVTHHGQPSCAAVGLRAIVAPPVGVALPRTCGAVGQSIDRLAGSAGKFTAFQQSHVTGPGRRHRTASTNGFFATRPTVLLSIPDNAGQTCPGTIGPASPKKGFCGQIRPVTMSEGFGQQCGHDNRRWPDDGVR